MTQREYLDFLRVLEKMKCNTRHSWTSNGRQESVADHSYQLAVMALLLEGEPEFAQVDFNKVIRMCLLHDMGEAVTGDVPAFLKTDEDRETEEGAIARLLRMLPSSKAQEFRELFWEMEERSTPEAKLYKILDRAEAVIQHNEADLST